ncbi:hypothetical protein F4861DRAFT_494632 [Xylaria intraflava]|nr:hypothetical protein F4861DRAFT_494632 [Xylaria intraflava]
MANAQLMEEELQQSVVLSEEEEADIDEGAVQDSAVADGAVSLNPDSNSGSKGHGEDLDDLGADDLGEEDDTNVKIEAHQSNQPDELQPVPIDQEEADQEHGDSEGEDEDIHDEDGIFDTDTEVKDEEDEAAGFQRDHDTGRSGDLSDEDELKIEGDEEDEDEDEDEGVGAVKIKPGETDDEISESEPSDDSDSAFSDRGSGAESDDPIENEDDEDMDEFDAVDHALIGNEGSDPESETGTANGNTDIEEDVNINGDDEDGGDVSPSSTRRASAPRIARDLLPSQRGASKPDSHSMFSQLVLDEDPMDGSRILRKRKTSSTEGEEDVISLRKRRKNTADESIHSDAPVEQVNNSEETLTRQRSARSLRLKVTNLAPPCTIIKKTRSSLVLKLRVNAIDLGKILSRKPKSSKKRSRARTIVSQPSRTAPSRSNAVAAADFPIATNAEPSAMTPFVSNFSQPFYSLYDKETDELKGKPYGGILTEEQADTTKTLPTKEDRRRFDEAKQKAEEGWRNRLLTMQTETEIPIRRSKKTSCPVSQIECIEFGGWEIDTWYAAPYPEEYSRNRVLYICEFCLKYMNSDYVAWRHKLKCPAKHPPGDEIYRQGCISFFEVDGRKNPVYCQNLCLLAKLFLGSKTLYYDVEPFLFYVLCEYDDLGYHFVGYFSKEKRASSQNNVSCILTLPIHQRKGYGHLLIDFSYLLTRVEEKSGSPEKPLSDMGLVSYRNYWRLVLCRYLIENVPEDKAQKKGLSIRRISDDTGMTPDDVVSALEALRFLVRDPVTHVYAFRVDVPYCHKEVAKWEAKNYTKLNPQALTWTPYVMGRGNANNFELGPALNAIAPREEDEETKATEVIADGAVATDDSAVVDSPTEKVPVDGESAVLQSTEPNDNMSMETVTNAHLYNIGGERGSDHPSQQSENHRQVDDTSNDEHGWQQQYENIPAIRFQVFPPISKRPGMSRAGSSIMRSGALPHSSNIRTPRSRPRGRRATGGSVRRSTQKRSNATMRKSGGTGRGPGRWPKGTKKSDYGNAASGPGMPPAWIEKHKQHHTSIHVTDPDGENEMLDTVQVQVNEAGANRGGQAGTTFATFELREFQLSEFAPIENIAQPSASGMNEMTTNDRSDESPNAEAITMNQAERHEDMGLPDEEG